MACILTNDMLLENTWDIAWFGPSVSFPFFSFYCDISQFAAGVWALDGIIGTVILDSQSFITLAKASALCSLPLPFCSYPLPQHLTQPWHLVDAHSWWFYMSSIKPCIWIRQISSTAIQSTLDFCTVSHWLHKPVQRISRTWMKFYHHSTLTQIDSTSAWSTIFWFCPNVLSPYAIHCLRLAEGMALCLGYTWLYANLQTLHQWPCSSSWWCGSHHWNIYHQYLCHPGHVLGWSSLLVALLADD